MRQFGSLPYARRSWYDNESLLLNFLNDRLGKMITIRFNIEQSLYGLAFITALFVRLLWVGTAPLSDYESQWALQAMAIARGGETSLGSQPFPVILTSLLFMLFKETNALARFVSAFTGSLLVLIPWFAAGAFSLERRLRVAGVVTAFALALDPGLVAQSRLVGSPVPALVFTLLALLLGLNRRWMPAMISGALALLCGPATIHGGLGLTLAVILGRLLARIPVIRGSLPLAADFFQHPESRQEIKRRLLFMGGFILLGSTLFFRVPQGLGAVAASLSDYFSGWVVPSEIPGLRLPAALLVYQPLAVLLGMVGAARGWLGGFDDQARGLSRFLSLWFLAALALAMLYPGRQVGDVIWALVPLWGLASLELYLHLPFTQDAKSTPVIGQAVLVFTLLILVWFNLVRLARFQANAQLYLAVIGGIFLMGLIASFLFAAGWSPRAARTGTVWGISAALIMYMLAGTWWASQLHPNGVNELWNVAPSPGQAGLLDKTLGDLSTWNTGHRHTIDVIVTAESSSLRWLLRDFTQARFMPTISTIDLPSVVITPQDQDLPGLSSGYRGQDLTWQVYPAWSGVLPNNLTRWLSFREAPTATTRLILWARGDLFPGGSILAAEQELPFEEIFP